MAGKIIKSTIKAAVKRGRGRPKKSTKVTATKVDTGVKNATSKQIDAANKAAAAKRAKAAGRSARSSAKTKVLPTGSKRAIATSAAAIGGATMLNKKGSSAPAKVTFAEAFKKARAKGEGTKFTHNGKQYVAVTKTDLKKKGYDANELAAYNKRGGKARGPLNRLGQGVKKVLLGKDKKFGGDKGAIDFIRKPKKKAGGGMMKSKGMKAGGAMKSKGMKGGGMMKSKGYRNGGAANKRKATGAAKRGFGKAYMKGRR